jgi:hypothetical protein
LLVSKILFDRKNQFKHLNDDNHRSKKEIMEKGTELAGHRYRGSNPYRGGSISSP